MRQSNFLDSEEDKSPKVVNIASVPLRSPFRYPGGKTWFVPRLREWLKKQPSKPKLLIEPFVGGGIISLTAVFENLVDKSLMVELDDDVAAVWEVAINGDGKWLADRILKFEMNLENASQEINKLSTTVKDRAFKTILKNRCSHGGILASGSGFIKNGEGGKGILSRWYPETLSKRFKEIDVNREKLDFIKEDAFNIMDKFKDDSDAVFFIDPPYTAGGKKAGKRLYRHFEIDHELLFKKCASLKGDFIMTYDNVEEVLNFAKKYGFQAKPIAMKNTHHANMTELVIGRDLDWMKEINRVLEAEAEYKARK